MKNKIKAYWKNHIDDIVRIGVGAGLGLVAIKKSFMNGKSDWRGKKQVVFAPHPIRKGVLVKYFCADPKGAITVGDVVRPDMIDKLGFSKWSGFGADMPLQYIDFVCM